MRLTLVVLLLLTSVGTASAECAWVLWSKFYLKSALGATLEDWDVVDTTQSRAECIAHMDDRWPARADARG